MGVDERILHLVRTEMDKTLATLDGGEFREDPGLISRIDDLHEELHSLSTKVDELTRRLKRLESVPEVRSEPGTVAGSVQRPRRTGGTSEK